MYGANVGIHQTHKTISQIGAKNSNKLKVRTPIHKLHPNSVSLQCGIAQFEQHFFQMILKWQNSKTEGRG
jgi:hypothetical protein